MNKCSAPLQDVIRLNIKSEHTQRNYDIFIHAPVSTDGKKLSTVYVLDGQWDFVLFDCIYNGLKFDGFVEEMVIIGISYTGDWDEIHRNRALDYSPARLEGSEEIGQAPNFIKFLGEELRPLIESKYPTDPKNNILVGGSLAGTFALYVLFSQQNLFNKYIIASPWLMYDDEYVFKLEQKFSQENSSLDCRLYLTAGELESTYTLRLLQKFTETLKKREYKKFKYALPIVPAERHSGVKPETFNRGLRYVQSPDFITLPRERLEELAGIYTFENSNLDINIFIENGILRYHMPLIDENSDNLLAVTEEFFVSQKSPLKLVFSKSSDNQRMECAFNYNEKNGRAVKR